MMFQNFDFLYNLLKQDKTYISNVKYEKIHRSMLPYIHNIRKSDLIFDLNFIVKSVLTVIKLMKAGATKGAKFLFVGNNTDLFINNLIELTAEKSNQDFYNFTSKKLNYAKLREVIQNYNPDFLILLYPKNSLPLLKVAEELNIPVIGLCDVNYNNNYFTYFIPSNLSYRSIYVYCNLFIKALKN
uniref:Ribosomal protein S2 n=1 Tax=Thecamonas trahens TaxID=529818 RepID=A0A0B5GWB0_THETB|nr:ribosomal protein S2 [Thecamonas trahens]AJF36637.1 ribosomal protein S2 [Thecamonas trahens]